MRAPCASGSCSSYPHPGPSLHRADLQRILIENTILVHHPAETVHQHNATPQSLHFQPVSLTSYNNSQNMQD